MAFRLAAKSKKPVFWPKIDFKIKSLHLYKAITWFLVGISFLAIFVGHALAIFLEPVSP